MHVYGIYTHMPTTVRVTEDVKSQLDRLQGDFLSVRGERLSHSDLLARLLHFARLHADELLEDVDPARPTWAQLEQWLADLPDVRIDVRARDYKEALYGDRP